MEKEKLYTPIYVKTETEYFPGFGKKEFNRSVVMSTIVIFFSIILWLLLRDLAIVVITITLGITGTIMINTKNEANLSMYSFVCLMISYYKEQQRYLYRYMDEWESK